MNDGVQNEYDIVKEINGKMYSEQSENWQKALKKLCSYVEDNDIVYANKIKMNCKPDIFVRINNRCFYISVKVGISVSPHREYMDSFYSFLINLGVEQKYIETLKLYHFGDGTNDGTGNYHLGVDDVKSKYYSRILEFNEYINQDKFLYAIFNRMFKYGSGKYKYYADYLYLGNSEQGLMVKMDDLINYLVQTKSYYLDSIHFGPIIYAPGYRGITNFDPNKKDRFYVVAKWTTVIDDVNYLHGNITDYKKKFLKQDKIYRFKIIRILKKFINIKKSKNKK